MAAQGRSELQRNVHHENHCREREIVYALFLYRLGHALRFRRQAEKRRHLGLRRRRFSGAHQDVARRGRWIYRAAERPDAAHRAICNHHRRGAGGHINLTQWHSAADGQRRSRPLRHKRRKQRQGRQRRRYGCGRHGRLQGSGNHDAAVRRYRQLCKPPLRGRRRRGRQEIAGQLRRRQQRGRLVRLRRQGRFKRQRRRPWFRA